MNLTRAALSGLVITTLLASSAHGADDDASETPATAPSSNSAPIKVPAAKKETSDITDIVDKLEYPELQVIPRASQRLKIEAADEDHTWFYTHWPIQVSGLATLAVGLAGTQLRSDLSSQQQSDSTQVATITKTIGLGWVAAGVLLGLQRPYRTGMRTILQTKDSEKGERAALLRERLAEEALERPAKTMRVLTWVSVVTNFTASALMGAYLTDQGRITAGVSALLAFLPLAFEDHAIEVYEKHTEYKKKIYGPLSGMGFGFDPKNQELVPMTQLVWNF